MDAGSYDSDTNDTIVVTQIPPGPYPVGTNTVTLIVTDSHGASNVCVAIVIVIDTTPPDLTCPGNIVVANDPGQCSAAVSYSVSASDNCSSAMVNVSIYQGHSQTGGGAPYSGLVGSFSANGISFATDTGYNWHPFGMGDFGADITGCLNVAAAGTYTFILNSDDGSQLYIDGSLVADDGGVHAPGASTGTATLAAGNHTFEVQFFECCSGPSGVDLILPAGVSYAPCALAVTCNPPSGSVFPKGTTTVTCCANDAAGNTNCCSFTVTVEDRENPQINCGGDITVCNDPGQCSAVVAQYQVSASDNCPGVTYQCIPPAGSTFPKGSTPVVCVATDTSGNTSSCSFNVTVNDCEAPLAACRESLNPAGKKIPVAGKNPKSGQNPDGFYELLGKDNCDASSALSLYVMDGDTGYVFGPFANGDILKITQSNHDTIQPMAGVVLAHIQLVGDAFVYAVDSSGNVGASMGCFVPKPPK